MKSVINIVGFVAQLGNSMTNPILHKLLKRILHTIVVLMVGWGTLTWYVERPGEQKLKEFGNANGNLQALVVYDPDPFYNFDEQVCNTFSTILADAGLATTMASVSVATNMEDQSFDLFVLCANTYNWAPDWAISNYIKTKAPIKGKAVVAVTIGAGSTKKAQSKLEFLIKKQGGNLLASETFWLLRPNDESRMEESNVQVALQETETWAKAIVEKFGKQKK